MPYEKTRSKQFEYSFEAVYKAAYTCVKQLGGKILKSEPEGKLLHVQMDKKLKGEVLGDRSKLEMTFTVDEAGHTNLSIFAYPLNAVGQKLMFGARKGVVDRVLTVFLEEVEKRLAETE
ncbi:MAG: hypothetical protein V2I46_03085 [Bacteroides sp.]|jgi:hypothetical protein|nr:hypothetical protein [Bacteroides sp.]